MPSIERVLFGTEEAVDASLALRAGPLDMALRGGKLLHIRSNGRDIWHGVAFVFRDADWGTPEPVFERCDVTPSLDGFHVRLEGHFPVRPVIALRIDIEGTAGGHVRFTAEAVPSGDIEANRIGLCLMHPMSAMGARIDVEHVDGRLSRSTFPTLIPPWPPFMLIRAIRHEWSEGLWARCDLAGDIFELEDQRNNSDASFKTYSRSNLMPRPYRLSAGVAIRHSAELSLEAHGLAHVTRREAPVSMPVSVSVGEVAGALPRIGIEISASDADAPGAIRAALRALRPSHLHLSLAQAEAGSVDWHGIGALLADAQARLRLDLTITDPPRSTAALHALSTALTQARLVPEGIALFPGDGASIDAARRLFPASAIGGGTAHFFVQLNRAEALGDIDFASFTTSPIVHGADDDSVMLSLRSLPSMIATLRARWPLLPVRVGPSTIGARKSPLGRQPVTDGMHRVALAAQDPRCRGLYGAAWALGYVAQFAAAGVQALTLMSLGGPSAVVERGSGGDVVRHPAYFLLARLGEPAHVCNVRVSDPARIAALALGREGKIELLLANLTGEPVDLHLVGWPASAPASIMDASLREQAWPARRTSPASPRLRLTAYAIASLEQQ